MPEFVGKPSGAETDPDNLEWAEGSTIGVDVVEPSGSKRSDGWENEEEPPYEFLNWFQRLAGLIIKWLLGFPIRAFTLLESGASILTTPADEGHILTIGKASGPNTPLLELAAHAGLNPASVIHRVCSDSEFVYYVQGTRVYKVDRIDLFSNPVFNDLGVAINDLWCDGFAVFAVTVANAGAEVHGLDRLTLASLGGSYPNGTTFTHVSVRSNGTRVIAADNDAAGSPIIYNETTGANIGNLVYSSVVVAVEIDHGRIFVIGTDRGAPFPGDQLAAYDFTGGASLWSVPIPGAAGAATLRDLCSDGDMLWVVGNAFTDPATNVQANIWAFERTTGKLIYRFTGEGGNPLLCCSVDDRYLWLVDDTDELFQYDKMTGHFLRSFSHGSIPSCLDSDADAVFISGAAGTGSNRIRMLDIGNKSRLYVRTAGNDPNRRPLRKLLNPME